MIGAALHTHQMREELKVAKNKTKKQKNKKKSAKRNQWRRIKGIVTDAKSTWVPVPPAESTKCHLVVPSPLGVPG